MHSCCWSASISIIKLSITVTWFINTIETKCSKQPMSFNTGLQPSTISADLSKMASTEFFEEALSTDVDEKAVNAFVDTLEKQSVTSTSLTSLQNPVGNIISSQFSNLTSNAGSIISGQQKYNTDGSSCSGAGVLANSIYSAVVANSSAPYNNNVRSSTPTNYPSINLTGTVSNYSDNIQVYTGAQTSYNPNSVTFPAQPLPNTWVPPSSQIFSGVVPSAHQVVAMQQPLVIKQGTSTGQVGMQSGMVTVPMTVNSSMPGSIPNVMNLNKPGGQNVVVTSQNMGSAQPTIIPNVQILNMRPGAPAVAAQKSVATVSPRVVIGTPQVVGTRAAAPGITLQTLQSLQPGQQGHLLLKTENGQYQLLRVGPAPGTSTLTAPQPQTIRLSTVPAHPGVATVSTSMAPGPMQVQMPAPVVAPMVAQPQATIAAPMPQPQPPMVTTVKPSDNTKEKCRNFLANLLDLSSKEPPSVERNVRNLIQELIDAQVEPEEFCDRLERLLNASPQPCLIGFLKKSLPLLRQSLVTKELVIEGINPPAPHIAFSTIPSPSQPVLAATNMQMPADEESSSPILTPLLPPVLPLTPAPPLVPATKPNNIASTVTQHKPNKSGGGTIAVLQNIPVHTKINMGKVSGGKAMTVNSKSNFPRSGGSSAALSTVLTPGKSLLKEKEKKSAAQFSSQPFVDDKMAGDDDINDVAAMGGVNLAEETQRILGSTEMIGTQIRSCKDEYLVPMGVMQHRIKSVVAKHNLDEPSIEIAGLISHAVHERLKNLIEKLAVIAQHRIDLIKTDSRYDVTQDVKGQLKFLEELDRVDKKRREDSEREMLLRAAKSRSKNEDPEQAKLKAKAKEMQRAELEELRQREANLTALQAIGPRKKPRLEGPGGAGDSVPTTGTQNNSGFTGRSQLALRTRLKRINLRDMLFLLEQDREFAHSPLLFRSYLK